jgi:hypothetical protein
MGYSKDSAKQYYLKNKDKFLDYQYKKLYGISIEEVQVLRETQDFKCVICGRTEEEIGKLFDVDHDHVTKKVRGLLCHACNTALGLFQDSSKLLITAAYYLQQNEE